MATGGEPDQILYELAPNVWIAKVGSKIINLERFAYDVFVFSADTFGVPISCIPPSKRPKSDYEHHDFLLVVSRPIFRVQILFRDKWNEDFKQYIQFKNLESMDTMKIVGAMWNHFLKSETSRSCILLSLALTNELILYLYSNNFVYVRDLAFLWASWLYYHKEEYQEAGGLSKLYRLGLTPDYQCDDDINTRFIRRRCIPYEESAKNSLLSKEWEYVYRCFKKIARNREVPPPTPVNGRPDSRSNVRRSVKLAWYNIVTWAPDIIALMFGKPKLCEEPTRHREGLSSSSPGAEHALQGMCLKASEGKESSEKKPGVSVTRDTTSQDLTGATLKNPTRQPEGSFVEAKGQTENSEEEANEETNSDSWEDEPSDENEPSVSGTRDTTSQDLTSATLKNPTRQPEGSFVEAKGQTENSEDEANEETNSDSWEDEPSDENEPSVSGTRDTTSQDLTGAALKNPTRQPDGSFVEAKGQTENSEDEANEETNSDSWEDEPSDENEPSVCGMPEAKST